MSGRPTKYKPEYCKALLLHMAEGYTLESFAGVIGVNVDTLYEWAKVHSAFSDATKEGRALQLVANEKMMRDIAKGKIRNANATAAIFIMKNCHKWKDRHELEFTTPDKMSLEDLKKEAAKLLEELNESSN